MSCIVSYLFYAFLPFFFIITLNCCITFLSKYKMFGKSTVLKVVSIEIPFIFVIHVVLSQIQIYRNLSVLA